MFVAFLASIVNDAGGRPLATASSTIRATFSSSVSIGGGGGGLEAGSGAEFLRIGAGFPGLSGDGGADSGGLEVSGLPRSAAEGLSSGPTVRVSRAFAGPRAGSPGAVGSDGKCPGVGSGTPARGAPARPA